MPRIRASAFVVAQFIFACNRKSVHGIINLIRVLGTDEQLDEHARAHQLDPNEKTWNGGLLER